MLVAVGAAVLGRPPAPEAGLDLLAFRSGSKDFLGDSGCAAGRWRATKTMGDGPAVGLCDGNVLGTELSMISSFTGEGLVL
jgi:hypothetical protein